MQCEEILTSKESLARLKKQAEDKKAKQAGAKKGKAGAGVAGPSGPTVGAMDKFVKRGSRSSVRQRKPQHPQEEDPDDVESGHEDPPASQGTNPEDSTVVLDGLDTTAPVDMSGSLHAVAGPSAPRSPPKTPPRARKTRGQKRKVVEISTEDSGSDTANDESESEAPPPTPPRYQFSSEEELKKKLKARSSYVIFDHNGQMWAGIVDKIVKPDSIKIKKMKIVQDPQTQGYTGRWEFPPRSDKWTGRAWCKYKDIKHLTSPPNLVGTNTRPQYKIPKVDQYWVPPTRL